MKWKGIRYTVYYPELNITDKKYVITDTSGIGKLYKSVGCCKMTPVCVIFVTERN
jgi:hypothetical protein